MANPQATQVTKPHYAPPPVDGDFYRIADVLNDKERTLLRACVTSQRASSRR
jgi:glutaryl-CoA dehydrogenase